MGDVEDTKLVPLKANPSCDEPGALHNIETVGVCPVTPNPVVPSTMERYSGAVDPDKL